MPRVELRGRIPAALISSSSQAFKMDDRCIDSGIGASALSCKARKTKNF